MAKVAVLSVRIALHAGIVEEQQADYFGPPVNRVARLLSAGHGGQSLLSLATQELVRDALPLSVWKPSERRLKDLMRLERVFQVIASDAPSEFPPLRTLESLRNNLPPQSGPRDCCSRALPSGGKLASPERSTSRSTP